jgi:hypothetical protein
VYYKLLYYILVLFLKLILSLTLIVSLFLFPNNDFFNLNFAVNNLLDIFIYYFKHIVLSIIYNRIEQKIYNLDGVLSSKFLTFIVFEKLLCLVIVI